MALLWSFHHDNQSKFIFPQALNVLNKDRMANQMFFCNSVHALQPFYGAEPKYVKIAPILQSLNKHFKNFLAWIRVSCLCTLGLSVFHVINPQLERRHEQMKRNLEAQYKELEEKRRVFEDEKANWEAQQRILEQQKLDASKSVHP